MTWKFELNNGRNGIKHIVDELISDVDIATQRAASEFLDNGYKKRFVNFTTHRTDIAISDIINVSGLAYIVTKTTVRYNKGQIVTHVEGVRYE